MKTLLEVLHEAERNKVAIGHFNFSDLVGFNAIVAAARELNLPVMMGVSEGEREFTVFARPRRWSRAFAKSTAILFF